LDLKVQQDLLVVDLKVHKALLVSPDLQDQLVRKVLLVLKVNKVFKALLV
jgi:hypothetical protein